MGHWLITRQTRALLIKTGLTTHEADEVIERLRSELAPSEPENTQTPEAKLESFCNDLAKDRLGEHASEEQIRRGASRYHTILASMAAGFVSSFAANEATPLVERLFTFLGRGLQGLSHTLERFYAREPHHSLTEHQRVPLEIDETGTIPDWILKTNVFILVQNDRAPWQLQLIADGKFVRIAITFRRLHDKDGGKNKILLGPMFKKFLVSDYFPLRLTDRQVLALSRCAPPEIILQSADDPAVSSSAGERTAPERSRSQNS